MKQVGPVGCAPLLTHQEGPPELQLCIRLPDYQFKWAGSELHIPLSQLLGRELKQDRENWVTPEVTFTSKDM